jgi:hypothetical protein
VELWPVLAAADRLAGRQPSQEPLVVQLDTLVTVPGGAGQAPGAESEDHVDAKVSRKGRGKSKGSKSSGDKHGGSHRHSSGGGDKRGGGHRRSSGGGGDAGAAAGALLAAGQEQQAQQQTQHIELDHAPQFDAAQVLYAHGRPSYVSLPL